MEGRAVTVHDLEHARIALTAAAEVGRPVILLSAPAIAQAIGIRMTQLPMSPPRIVHEILKKNV